MRKVKFIFKKIKNLQLKPMIGIIKKIHKKTNRLSILIFLDIIYCAMTYGSGYMDYFEFEFYLLNKDSRKTYLTSSLNNEIIRKYNQASSFYMFANKITFNQIFHKFVGRKHLFLTNDNFDDFHKFTKEFKRIVVKPVDACGGIGIELFTINQKTNLQELHSKLVKENRLLVEECLIQHEKMASLNQKSLNTLRVLSFLKEDGNVEILTVILKIGTTDIVDNFSKGGMYTFADLNGKVIAPAINQNGEIFSHHPISKTEIVGFQIPEFDRVKELVFEVGKVIPNMRYIGWDIAITPNGPIVIEGNEYSGIFQLKPSLSKEKIGNLPQYRKYMDI